MSNHQLSGLHRHVDDLVPFDRNSRTHSAAQIAQLAASIKEFGFTSPVLIDENNMILAGEGRVKAAKKAGLNTVPCVVLAGLTAEQKAAYVIADNKLALNSGWDEDMLHAELARLAELNFNINLTGFNDVEALELSFEVTAAGTSPADPTQAGETPATERKPDEKDWSGMPAFEQPDDKPFRTIIVHFDNQDDVERFALSLALKLTDQTKSVWFPRPPAKVTLTNEHWAVEP